MNFHPNGFLLNSVNLSIVFHFCVEYKYFKLGSTVKRFVKVYKLCWKWTTKREQDIEKCSEYVKWHEIVFVSFLINRYGI